MSVKENAQELWNIIKRQTPKVLKGIFLRKDKESKKIIRRDFKRNDNETSFYYALTRNIDKKELDSKEKEPPKDKVNPIISDDMFNLLVEELNYKIKEADVSKEPGKLLDNIYEQLTQIVLYLYKDEKSIIENSLAKRLGYSSKDEYVYSVVEEIIENIDKKHINIIPKYVEQFMQLVFSRYLNIINLNDLKKSIVQMAIQNSKDIDDGIERENENLQTIIEFYNETIFSDFSGTQITLKELNEITKELKELEEKRLHELIQCIQRLSYKKNDDNEAKILLNQIKQISQLELRDIEQIYNKINCGKLNTTQLQVLLDKIENKNNPEKKQIKGAKKTIIPNKKYIIVGGIPALVALIGGMYLLHQSAVNTETTINPSNATTESIDETILDLANSEEGHEEKEEDRYSLFYPALYKENNENGEEIKKLAYVAVDNKTGELDKSNTMFMLQENSSENGNKTYTYPITGVKKEDIIYPITKEFDVIDGKNVPLRGYSNVAFKTLDTILTIDNKAIKPGEIVAGVLLEDNEKQQVYFTYYDEENQEVYTGCEDISYFESDIHKNEIDPNIQFIGTFRANSNIQANNGQCIILEGTELDLYLSNDQVCYKSPSGTIVEASSIEIPYVQTQLHEILRENPNLKLYSETLGFGDYYEAEDYSIDSSSTDNKGVDR